VRMEPTRSTARVAARGPQHRFQNPGTELSSQFGPEQFKYASSTVAPFRDDCGALTNFRTLLDGSLDSRFHLNDFTLARGLERTANNDRTELISFFFRLERGRT